MNLIVSQTGIRSGEVITGNPKKKQSKGVVIKVRGLYKPSKKDVENMDELTLRDKLNNVPFFRDMSVEQRYKWLMSNSTDENNMYLEDSDIEVKFVKIEGNNFFKKKLSLEQLELLINGNPNSSDGYWPIMDVYNMFPLKNPNSRAKKKTLVFRPSNWVLYSDKGQTDNYSGMIFELKYNGVTLKNGTVKIPSGSFLNVVKFTTRHSAEYIPVIGIIGKNNDDFNVDALINLSRRFGDVEQIREVMDLIKWFTPAVHKSLMQKLIRARPKNVLFSDVLYDSRNVMMASIIMLMTNPGVFVPNIQRFVTGMESFAKRLAVSILEDSYTTKNNLLLQLFTVALLSQDNREWRPDYHMVEQWFILAIEAIEDPRMFEYNWQAFNPVGSREMDRIKSGIQSGEPLSYLYLLLNELRSFESDIKMLGSIMMNNGRYRYTYDSRMQPMKLIHCLDHHSLTEIAHYMDYSNESYKKVFSNIWNMVVGVNPRKEKYAEYVKTMESTDFAKQVRNAQANLWISKLNLSVSRKTIPNYLTRFDYVLDETWLAGLIGSINVKVGRVSAIVVLRTDDIYTFKAIKKPGRGKSKKEILTEEEEYAAINKAINVLKKGYKLQFVPEYLSDLKNAMVTLSDNGYLITLRGNTGKNIYWSDYTKLHYKIPVHPTIELSLKNASIYNGTGQDANSHKYLNYILTNYPIQVYMRLYKYINAPKTFITMEKISRDGTAVYYDVQPEDTAVYHILSYLSIIYPFALEKKNKGFLVKNGPLLWQFAETVNGILREHQTKSTLKRGIDENSWPIPAEEKRKRWEHQSSSLKQMITRQKKNKKGHIIWIKVGLGKTLIVIDYIDYLIRSQQMPPYLVYTLPPSAINNTVSEFQKRNIPVQVMDATQKSGKSKKTFKKYQVSIVKHDHLRLFKNNLYNIANQSVFIYDEFHKLLNATQRTSTALELSHLSRDFIALSGTIIKDTNYQSLIKWLEQVTEFEVNEQNYWVALGSIVSRKVETKVVVNRETISLEMSPEVEKIYYSYVPKSLGGIARNINFKSAVDLSYSVVNQGILNYILHYYQHQEGTFVVARNRQTQIYLQNELIKSGIPKSHIFLFDSKNQITLTPDYTGPIKIVITTPQHSEGYTLTKFKIMITGVYFSNQATRDQLEGRINRINQNSPEIFIYILHSGILSYVLENYEQTRSIAKAISGFAENVSNDYYKSLSL